MQIIISISSAQSYKPTLSEENSWNVVWGACDASRVDSIFSARDSIVDSLVYASLYLNEITNKIGYLEEDTVLGLLTYHDESGKSFLLFDSSLVPEDTVKYTNNLDMPVELVVSDTSTIDGLKYIEFEENIAMC